MDEAARFLRYMIPGAVSMAVAGCILLATDPCAAFSVFRVTGNGAGIGYLMAAVLGSGALGYLHANLYFVMVRQFPSLSTNHEVLFAGACPVLQPVDINNRNLNALSEHERWSIVARYWDSQIHAPGGNDIRGLDALTQRLVHHVHSLGGCTLGVFLALPYAWILLWLLYKIYDKNGFVYMCTNTMPFCGNSLVPILPILVTWLVLMVILYRARARTRDALQWIVNSQIVDRRRNSINPLHLSHVSG